MTKFRNWLGLFVGSPLFMMALATGAQTPQWIWDSTSQSGGKQTLYFRKSFLVNKEIHRARLSADADDYAEFYINGKKVATVNDWNKPANVDVTKELVHGENIFAVRATNEVSAAGVLARLELITPTSGSAVYKPKQHAGLRWIDTVVTDTNWLYSDREFTGWKTVDYDDGDWKHAVSEGKVGCDPWGNVFKAKEATAAESIKVEPGFKVELLHSAEASEGSWISMVADDKGRLIISPQSDDNLLRVTISRGEVAKIERINQPVHTAMGLLYFDNWLYVNGQGPKGTGIYRLHANGDKFEKPEFLREMEGGTGEHGSHGLVLGPDKKIYVVSGNFTKIPKDLLPSSPFKNYADDQLLPRAPDGKGFGNGLLPPGGFVIRMNPDGSHCELFAAGTRNTYDIAFSPDGELFGFDSDMEWDWGTPWYRPIRINHWVSGADYGFREGSGKFPEYYEDTLPSIFNVGIGSPTGVMFGTRSKFPERYRSAFYMLDWAYGRIYAAHLVPHGASYDATVETILRGIPLNLTALEFGKDGAMYFITGGRGTESGLYRLTYVGPKLDDRKTADEIELEKFGAESRQLRHDLESFQGKRDPRIIDTVWPALSSEDRWIRYAARTALEFQDAALWKEKAVNETNPIGGLTALLALARCGPAPMQRDLLLALKKFPLANLDEQLQLLKLRVIELSFSRQGRPDADLAKLAIEKLDAHFPSTNELVNRELCEILLYLNAPDAITKTLTLLDQAKTQEDQTYYILRLRTITNGWTLDQRRHYLSWFSKDRDNAQHPPELLQYFKDAERDYSDGASLPTFLTNFFKESIEGLSAEEKTDLAEFLPSETNAPKVAVKAHKFIKDWRMSDVEPDLEQLKSGRSFAKGKAAFTDGQCILCHRFGKTGGSVGPELAAVSSRLTSRDILESILLPSKVLSEQYQNTTLVLKDGDDVSGRIVAETDQKYVVMTDLIKETKVDVRKTDVASRHASKISPMPEGLANFMTEDQILDLIAYLQSGGKKSYAAFKKAD